MERNPEAQPKPWIGLAAIPWTRFSIEAENQLEANIHPHIGRLGTARIGEKELSAVTPDGLADEEVDFPEDLALLPIRSEIRSQLRREGLTTDEPESNGRRSPNGEAKQG